MKFAKLLRYTALGLSLGFVALSAGANPVLGQPAPAFTATTADGAALALSSLRGKTVVLEWTNHDCPFVKKHYESGNIPSLQKDAAAKGYVWLQVISSAPGKQGHVDGATAIRLNKERGATPANTLLDPEGKLGRLYGAQTSPHLFIIDPAGTLIYKGGIDSIPSAKKEDLAKADNYLRLAFADLAAGRKIAQASTQPYGCSIKYAD